MNKILIVEDDIFLLEMLAKECKQEGFDFESAVDGEDAIDKIETKNFDIILLDLVLPKMHGLELLKKMKEKNNTTPVIVISNLYDQETFDEAMSLGAKDYIIKAQSTPNNIISKVKTFLSKKDTGAVEQK